MSQERPTGKPPPSGRGAVTFWTDERRRAAAELWVNEGLSASQIAERIGAPSRSAVLSQLAQQGLMGAKKGSAPRPARRSTSKPRAKKSRDADQGVRMRALAKPKPSEVPSEGGEVVDLLPDPPVPLEQRRGVADLEPTQCRWPIGDPRDSDFHFCCRDKVLGQPYCEGHARRALGGAESRSGAPFVLRGHPGSGAPRVEARAQNSRPEEIEA